MNVYEMLSRDNYLTVNKLLMRHIGISESILLSELCYRRQFLDRSGKMTKDGFFYATVEDVEEETTLNDYAQRKILDKLKDMGLVEVERRGLPAKRYIYIDEEALQFLINSITSNDAPVPENLENKTLKNSGQINNNINNNKSHVLSKDNTFDKGHSQGSARPETTSSGKLFTSQKPKSRKSSVQKINSFISNCRREAFKKGFSDKVMAELDSYFRMLAEMNCLLPSISISEQLSQLKKVSEDKQVLVINNTISRGWKSLQYEVNTVMENSRPSWDTAEPGTFQATPEEEKNGDWKKDIPEDHIF